MSFKSIQTKIAMIAGMCLLGTSLIIVILAARGLWKQAGSAHEASVADARELVRAVAQEQGRLVQSRLDEALISARSLGQALQGVPGSGGALALTRGGADVMIQQVLKENPNFLGVYTCWEPNAFDGKDAEFVNAQGSDATGRYISYWTHGEGGAMVVEPLLSYEVEGDGDYYLLPKKKKLECLINPYMYPVQGVEVLITSMVAPMLSDGKFYGITGIDIALGFIQTIVDDVEELYDDQATLALIAADGTLAAVTKRPELAGKKVAEFDAEGAEAIQGIVEKGEAHLEEEGGMMSVYVPIRAGRTDTAWSLNVRVPMSKITETADQLQAGANRNVMVLMGISTLCIFGGIAVLWFLSRGIVRPISAANVMLRDISEGEGDLTKRLQTTTEDEVGAMSRYFNHFVEKLQGIVGEIAGNAGTLHQSSDDLSVTASTMAGATERMNGYVAEVTGTMVQASQEVSAMAEGIQVVSGEATNVAQTAEKVSGSLNKMGGSVEQMSSRMNSIAATTEEMSANVNAVAAAIEEMSSSINEVSQNSSKAAEVATGAAKSANSTSTQLQVLGKSAQEIGKVVELIDGIAAQTNLLALNATIEAASAGEAGRGFAVVAGEVKELAKQTATATEDIRKRVEAMQSNSTQAIQAIEAIVAVIDDIRDISGSIAAAVEEQTSTVGEIARNIGQAAEGTNDVSREIQQAAREASDVSEGVQATVRSVIGISESMGKLAASATEFSQMSGTTNRRIQDVSQAFESVQLASEEAAAGAMDTNRASQDLMALAGTLKQLVGQFRV